MARFGKIVKRINDLSEVFLVGTMLLIVSNVVLKVCFRHPILGAFELVGLFMSLYFAFSLAYCAIEGGHIAVEFFSKYFTIKVLRVFNIIISIVSFTFLLYCSFSVLRYAYIMYLKGDATAALLVPHFPFIFGVGVGMFFLALTVLVQTFREGSEDNR